MLVIVGLGPGDSRYLTKEAWEILTTVKHIFVRTERHPSIAELSTHTQITSFDHLYESSEQFTEVYGKISERLFSELNRRDEGADPIIYAVPGDATIGEASVSIIREYGEKHDLDIRIINGVSFLEPTLTAIGIDGLDGVQIYDALELISYYYPPINSDIGLILGQVYDQLVAGELKLRLMSIYPEEHTVILVHGAGTDQEIVEETRLYEIDRSKNLAHLSTLYVPPTQAHSALPALAETVAYLRGPDGCPWDQEQTRQSMRATLMEETAEVLEAIDNGDDEAICEELGDLLYHLVMQAQFGLEGDTFRLTDVISGIISKLKRRHPHVWGNLSVSGSSEVLLNWERLKKDEKARSAVAGSELDNIPSALPALSRAQKIQERVSGVGFDWPDMSPVFDKVLEEIDEVKEAVTKADTENEVGDLLFAVVNWARWLEIDAESALRKANSRFEHRFRKVEEMISNQDRRMEDLTLAQLDEMWEDAKMVSDRK